MRYIVACVCILLAGCGGAGAGLGVPAQAELGQSPSAASITRADTIVADVAQDPTRVYIVDKTETLIYSLGTVTSSNSIAGPADADTPQSIALSPAGNLYVSDFSSSGHVIEYSANGEHHLATLTHASNPNQLVFDGAGNLYVAGGNAAECPPCQGIYVYAPGSTTPSRFLAVGSAGSGFGNPRYLSVDGENNLYAVVGLYGDANVFVYPPGSSSAAYDISDVSEAVATAADANGTLYVANDGFGGQGVVGVAVFPQGRNQYSHVITDGAPYPVVLGVDQNQNLYVGNYDSANGDGGTIAVYARGAKTPTYTITTPAGGIAQPLSFAFNAKGDLYVAYRDFGVHEYAAGTANHIRTFHIPHPASVVVGR